MLKPQIDPPGRALSSLSLYSGEAAGEGRVERNAGGRMKTDWAQLLAHLLPLPSFSSFGLLLLFFFLNTCVTMSMGMRLHIVTHAPIEYLTLFLCSMSLSLTGEQRPAVSDGGDLPFRVSS